MKLTFELTLFPARLKSFSSPTPPLDFLAFCFVLAIVKCSLGLLEQEGTSAREEGECHTDSQRVLSR